jgi:hypothetical protein
MLDDLLGRTELKERIEELREERDRLEERLDAESERRREAVSARQEAQERANRLEDRIADLEGRLDAGRDSAGEGRGESGDGGHGFRHEETLRGERLEAVRSRLAAFEGDPESVLTAYVEEGVPEDVPEVLGDRALLVDRAAPCVVWADDAGLLAAAARPAVAPARGPFVEWGETPRVDPAWLRPTGRFALALVRSDTFAVGVYEGTDRVDYEGFTTDVKSDHSKGGFSQARFERLRDEQIAAHLKECREALAAVEADRLYVVGDRRLVEEIDVDADGTAAVDATGDPEAALADAFDAFWTVRLYGL